MQQAIHILCPHCNQQLKVAGATAGRQVQCPQCRGFVRVPDSVGSSGVGPPRWVVRDDSGKVYGPVAREELLQWIDEGRIHYQSQISPEDAQQWIWAGEMFPQLAPTAQFAPAPTRIPTPLGPRSDRSRLVAGLLGLLLPLVGIYGVHRFYLGHIGLGILMLITFGGCGIWQLIDVILVFAGSVRDAEGLPLRE